MYTFSILNIFNFSPYIILTLRCVLHLQSFCIIEIWDFPPLFFYHHRTFLFLSKKNHEKTRKNFAAVVFVRFLLNTHKIINVFICLTSNIWSLFCFFTRKVFKFHLKSFS